MVFGEQQRQQPILLQEHPIPVTKVLRLPIQNWLEITMVQTSSETHIHLQSTGVGWMIHGAQFTITMARPTFRGIMAAAMDRDMYRPCRDSLL